MLLLNVSGTLGATDIARIVAQFDPRMSVRATSLAALLAERLRPFHYAATVAVTLGLWGLALATIGTFGVFMYSVRQRTREIGVRIALGARPSAVVRLMLGGQSRALLWGGGAGIVGAAGASAILRSAVYGISPLDPVVYAGVVAALAAAGLAARAVSVSAPCTMLRTSWARRSP